MAVIEHGRIRWKGFGVKDANRPDLVDARTIFEAASLSKPVFAYAVLKLVDEGKLDLDTPLSKYVPDYISDDRLALITVRRVLTHTTGLPNWRPGGKTLVIHFTPGERFSYSGEGFVFLQRAVEHLTGQPLERLAEEMVFRPLKMSDSSYVWRSAYDETSATGHNQNGQPSRKNKPRSANAAFSLHTTAPDYARFMLALMTGKGLSRKLAREMLSPQVRVDAGCFNCIGKPQTHAATNLAWGLGVGIQDNPAGGAFWHWGDNGVFRCFMTGQPRRKRGIVIFTNSENGFRVMAEVVNRFAGGPQPAFEWLQYER